MAGKLIAHESQMSKFPIFRDAMVLAATFTPPEAWVSDGEQQAVASDDE
jgi:hypothetical protein